MLSHAVNDAFVAINRLVQQDENIYWLTEEVELGGTAYPEGTVYIEAGAGTASRLAPMAAELGLHFEGVAERPHSDVLKLHRVRVGLWDRYGGSMASGWTRWLFEQFEFPFELVYPQELDAGRLARNFDVLVFVSGGIPGADPSTSRYRSRGQPDSTEIPAEYHHMLGNVTAETTVPHLREFMEAGGTVITIGSSTALAEHLGLPIRNHLVDEQGYPLQMIEYFVPTSILEVRVDNSVPVAYGMNDHSLVVFANSPTFTLAPEAAGQNLRPVAWFDTDAPLRSGWAWGQEHLEGGVAMLDVEVGDGKLYMFGPEIVRRAEPHGTFKFLFNGIYLSTAEKERLR